MYPESDIPISESIEEIICEVSDDDDDDEEEILLLENQDVESKYLIGSTTNNDDNPLIRDLISPISSVVSDHLYHLDAVHLTPPMDDVKSVVSASDYGYESLGSPNIDEFYSSNANNEFDIDMTWNNSLNDLFPSLIWAGLAGIDGVTNVSSTHLSRQQSGCTSSDI